MVEFARRWAVQGRKPNGDTATTIFDLLHDRRHVMVYPATLAALAVVIDGSAVRMLVDTAMSRTACAVPAVHAVHGHRLLGLHPYDSPSEPSWTDRPADAPPYLGPMELYLVLPHAEMRIVYRRERLHLLADTFGYLIEWLH